MFKNNIQQLEILNSKFFKTNFMKKNKQDKKKK